MTDATAPRWPQALSDRLDRLAESDSMRAIREGLLWIIPSLLVSASFLVLAAILNALGRAPLLAAFLLVLHQQISDILPLLIAASIGYMLAIRHRLPRLPVAFLCFAYVAIAASLLREHPRAAATLILFIAIASPIVNVPFMSWLHRQNWTRIARMDIVASNLGDALNLVIPGMLTAMLLAGSMLLLQMTPLFDSFDLSLELPMIEHPYQSGMMISALNSLLWFFGIHGYHALFPVFELLEQAVAMNALDVQSGNAPMHHLNGALMGAFVFIGGSGATFSLTLAILFFCRHSALRLLAWASLPIALLNVNEILLFGLPIILNPRLAIPFFALPMLNVMLALAITQAGWVAPAVVSLPLNSPVWLNAYLATAGDLAAILLQIGLVLLGTLVYAPFIRAIDREGANASSIRIRSLDTTFTQLHEEASLYADDPVVFANSFRKLQRERNEQIRRISEYEFYLEYQPQVGRSAGLCGGCEALLRARDAQGNTQQPWEFLNWLEQAGLMKELDVWVANMATRQMLAWQASGLTLRMTVNVTGHTLEDPAYLDKLIGILARTKGAISVEITEQTLAGDIGRIRTAIAAVHRIGARVYIDDFGTGYSSLSYLHQFDIDCIKIDRSFVLAQQDAKGSKVMQGLLRFAEALDLDIVVEGVETEAQLQALASERELVIQGWYFSKSLSGDDMATYARQRNAGITSSPDHRPAGRASNPSQSGSPPTIFSTGCD